MLTIKKTDRGIHVVKLAGPRLDAANAPAVRQELTKLVDEGARHIVIDLAKVTFVDSSGLGALVNVLKKVGNTGDLALASIQPAPDRAFRLTRMDKVFRVFADTDAALAALAG